MTQYIIQPIYAYAIISLLVSCPPKEQYAHLPLVNNPMYKYRNLPYNQLKRNQTTKILVCPRNICKYKWGYKGQNNFFTKCPRCGTTVYINKNQILVGAVSPTNTKTL